LGMVAVQKCKTAGGRWKGAKVRVQSTDYRFQKYEDANFPVPGSVAFR
jgi:hypothetical protein